ncbi:UDP-glucose 4-epimerase GalE [Paenalcaligenes niemegkensis]|uniref:UDP-glucose 4-epimerase GalE n=1 Tax=Paenalcaligenes niemegkensis TaxID=2895469 RepID=UPI001EE84E1E|nr:UDP-glucose 4-epimerase GalE [Paenalcaligenes niemegkensis]MCQ9615600.1 UDP-glucose 4-epimerase GalE [Paenalcaligenes niemegkensis]
MSSFILVTGGTGYIGSHTTVALQQAGHQVLILDNLSNSSVSVLDAIAAISGQRPDFIEGDIRDATVLARVFCDYRIDAVMHFAGLKAVGESVQFPLRYYDNNVHGSLQLLSAMQTANVRTFIFSSSATVYGDPQFLPLTEDHPLSSTNPYGHSKLMVEEILANLYQSEDYWRIARLRYFNPVGAHSSGLIGEAPQGIPNNLMPFVAQVATGTREHLQVFGNDYDTPDGTGVRDYIHVQDLADGHVAALKHCLNSASELLTVNLGTGIGYSVLEMVKAFERTSDTSIAYKIAPRRPGDIAACWADTLLAEQTLGWKAQKGIQEMCDDAWRWQRHFASREKP